MEGLEGCPACRGESGSLRAFTGNLSSDLARIRLPEGFLERTRPDTECLAAHRRWRGALLTPEGWLRAAALLLLLHPLAAVGPVRAWVADWLSGSRSGERSVPAADGPTAPTQAGSGSAVISFSPPDEALGLKVVARPAAGTRRLQPLGGAAGVLRIEDGPAERALVSERVVRTENCPRSTSSIDFWIPSSVRRFRVWVAGEALAEVEVDALEEPRVIELGTGNAPGAPRCQNPARGGIYVAG